MPINPTRILNQSVTTNATSSTLKGSLEPDSFGFVAVNHSGAKFASGDTVAISLEGSYDGGTTWFVLETMLPRDTDYLNQTGDVPSWFRIVAVTPDMRVRVNNGNSRTYQIWIAE
jgi:hypothetical protein